MEETPASQKMAKIDLINSLEKISSEVPDRILKLPKNGRNSSFSENGRY